MEMKINSTVVRAEREKRAWSQQHLADAAGLGLRTIQRIEKNGVASYESFHAIASCLEINVSVLRVPNESPPLIRGFIRSRRGIASGTIALLVAGVAALSMQRALADKILLDLGVTKVRNHDTHELATEIQLESGKPYQLTMPDAFKFNVSATLTGSGQILIAAEVFDYSNGKFILLAEPKLLVDSGEEATIELGTDDGQQGFFRIVATPQVQ